MSSFIVKIEIIFLVDVGENKVLFMLEGSILENIQGVWVKNFHEQNHRVVFVLGEQDINNLVIHQN